MARKKVIVDTRTMGLDRDCPLDGFVHLVPRSTWLSDIHSISMECWCDPRVVWPEDGHTLVVSHHDKRPGKGTWKVVTE